MGGGVGVSTFDQNVYKCPRILVCLHIKDTAINNLRRQCMVVFIWGFQLLNAKVFGAISVVVESILTFCLMILRFIVSTQ